MKINESTVKQHELNALITVIKVRDRLIRAEKLERSSKRGHNASS